ncbi:DNA-directed RNA polymerase III subunit RPC5-like protein, partial [Euroglyphus maynei]
NKVKTFALAGLGNVIDNTSPFCDISIRTDSKELKITPKQRDHHCSKAIFTTKESQLNLRRISFAVKFSRETGKAYFLPINSMHTLCHLDEKNRDSIPVDSQNVIFEDCFKMPHPTRNKHDQLRVEMKSHLYKPLTRINDPEMVRKFFDQLFTLMSARRSSLNDAGGKQQSILNNKNNSSNNRTQGAIMELMNCPYWFLSKINISDVNRIELVELKVEILMRKVQVIRFAEMIMLFHSNNYCSDVDHHHSKLLNTLQSICYLIDGNWVIKSHLLYKFDTIHDSECRQLMMKRLIAAREFLLWHFAHQKPLEMNEMIDKFKVS